MEVNCSWSDIKSFSDSRKLSIQWFEIGTAYYLFAADGPMHVTSQIQTDGSQDDDKTDFETNYKAAGNLSPNTPVTTQFEKRDKTVKLCRSEADIVDGLATILIKVPGTPGSSDGRWISSGTAFFDVHADGDYISGVYFVDHDNILGNGADSIVGSYTEDELDEENKGWWIRPNGFEIAEALGGYGFAPAGFYMKITGKKGDGSITGKFRINLEWGKTE